MFISSSTELPELWMSSNGCWCLHQIFLHAECVRKLLFRRDIISSASVSLSFHSDFSLVLEFLPPYFLVLLSVCSWTYLVLLLWQKKKVLYLPVVPSDSVGKEISSLAETHLWKANQSGTTFFHYVYLRATV